MRLHHLEVSGFRGFATKQEFDLSADATIIVGSNGLGKTSLLDAVQWGLSGRLGRLGKGDENVLSLYAETGQARVSLSLLNDNDSIRITRAFDGESQNVSAYVNEKELRGASAKARIFETLWPDAGNSNDGEESLSMALTRSVYLQQDRLTSFLEGADDQERFNVISELVGAGRLTDLQNQLEKEARSWTKQTTKFRREQTPLANRVEELKALLDRLQQAAKLGEQLSESTWADWWEECGAFELSVSETPSPTSADTSSLLDRTLRELQASRDQLKRRSSLLNQTKDFVANIPAKPVDSIDDLRLKLKTAKDTTRQAKAALAAAQTKAAEIRKSQVAATEEEEQRRALAQLALNLLEDQCPVCKQSYDVEGTRNRLIELIDSKRRSRNADEDIPDIESFTEKMNDAIQKETAANRLMDEAVSIHNNYLSWERSREEKISELGITAEKDLASQIKSLIKSCDTKEQQAKLLVVRGEQLSLNLARESASARIKKVETDLEKATQDLVTHKNTITKRETTSETTKLLIEQLRQARSKVAIEKLSEIEPILQRIFARIDPHPTFRDLKLATEFFRGKGRLDAEIHDMLESKFSKTPETVLSSSQLNALAVSIFLSLNLALPNLPLQAALLDDPIQSLDDINLLGLVDLLRRTKDRRQLVVSTHDARFGKLLARKLRPASDEQTTSVIELRGWNRTGPEVRQFPIEADTTPFKLVAV